MDDRFQATDGFNEGQGRHNCAAEVIFANEIGAVRSIGDQERASWTVTLDAYHREAGGVEECGEIHISGTPDGVHATTLRRSTMRAISAQRQRRRWRMCGQVSINHPAL